VNLDFSDEQKTLKGELRRVLAGHPGVKSARDALEGRAAFDESLWRSLGELGWLSAAIPEANGGQGLGHEMLCCVAEEIGRSLAAVPFSSSIVLVGEALLVAGSEAQKQAHLPALASGKRIGALAIAESAGPLVPQSIAAVFQNGRLSGTKIGVTDGMIADLLVTVALRDGKPELFLVDARGGGVERQAQIGVDPSRAPARVRFENAPAATLGATNGWDGIQRLLDRAAIVMAFEQVGTAEAALEMARDYALVRRAFGRPIGSFQAIKHKLADVYVANELARSNAYFGAWALQADAKSLSLAAATARVAATEALERAALIQVHGGIGVTWEHDCHLYYRRSQHLAVVLGGLREWQHRLVAELARGMIGSG
jgi:alkylation response protein AidB-like acyl-CoA dehydrogenase